MRLEAAREVVLVRPPDGLPDAGDGLLAKLRSSFIDALAAGGGTTAGSRFSLELPPNVTASVRIPSDDPAAVRDRAGSGPVSVAGYPGAPGAAEAVFAVGPGSHEFTGPELTSYGR